MDAQPLHRACDLARSWLDSLRDRPVGVPVAPAMLHERLARPLSAGGVDPATVIDDLADHRSRHPPLGRVDRAVNPDRIRVAATSHGVAAQP